MKASERLRELAASQALEGRFPSLPDYEADVYLSALPLIADVVEAAENAVTCAWMDKATDEQNAELKRRADAIDSSVAALRDALEPEKL